MKYSAQTPRSQSVHKQSPITTSGTTFAAEVVRQSSIETFEMHVCEALPVFTLDKRTTASTPVRRQHSHQHCQLLVELALGESSDADDADVVPRLLLRNVREGNGRAESMVEYKGCMGGG